MLNFHSLVCPSVLLKYTLSAFLSGGMYQLPHLSLATSGRAYAVETEATNAASDCIDRRRLCIERADRLRDVSVEEIELACVGKIKSDWVSGRDMPNYGLVIFAVAGESYVWRCNPQKVFTRGLSLDGRRCVDGCILRLACEQWLQP